MATQNKLNALRRLLLGPLFDKCKENPLGVKEDELKAHLDTLKSQGCIGDCTIDEFVKMCQLKSHYPSCMKDTERGCVEDWFGKQTGINKVYYNNYMGAKRFEDEPDDEEEDEDEIVCAICSLEPDDEEEEKDMLRSCGHHVHKECLIRVADSKYRDYTECPVCRKKFSNTEIPMPELSREERMKLSLRRSVRDFIANGGSIQEYARNNQQNLFKLLNDLDMDDDELKSLLRMNDEEFEALVVQKVEKYYEGTNQLMVRYTEVRGVTIGPYEFWYENGVQKVKAFFNDKGRLEGLYEEWYNNGNRHLKINYKDGKQDGLYEAWYKNGKRYIKCIFKNGKYHGLYEEWWYENGQRSTRITYNEDKIDGLLEAWHENGQILEITNYKNDKVIDPERIEYHDNGVIAEKETYKNGRKIKTEKFDKKGNPIVGRRGRRSRSGSPVRSRSSSRNYQSDEEEEEEEDEEEDEEYTNRSNARSRSSSRNYQSDDDFIASRSASPVSRRSRSRSRN